MNFSNPADIKSLLASLEREKDYTGVFWQRIKMNDFSLQISAGNGALSEPYTNLDKIIYYQSVGVLIYENIKEREEQVAPQSDVRFQNFEWVKYFQFQHLSGKTQESYIGSRISLADTIQLIRDVYKISRLKMFY